MKNILKKKIFYENEKKMKKNIYTSIINFLIREHKNFRSSNFFFFLKAMSTIFSQQILSGRLLLIVMDRRRSNLSCKFKLELIITYNL